MTLRQTLRQMRFMSTLFSAQANCLFDRANLASDNPVFAKWALGAPIALFGNWVGGRVQVTEDEIQFAMNGMNRLFQKDTAQLTVPLADVTAVGFGKMFKIARTVDCQTESGAVLRFRCFGAQNQKLHDVIAAKLTS